MTAADDVNHVFTIGAGDNGHVSVQDATSGLVIDTVNVEAILVSGGGGDDTLTVGDLSGTDITNDAIVFVGGDGNDVLDAPAVDVRVEAFGDAGNDTLTTGSGEDVLLGGTGNDTLTGGAGANSLFGEAGDDTLNGGSGADTMAAGLGNDTYVVDDAGDLVTEGS